MVEQVLRFAGLSSQHGELHLVPVEVVGLVDEAVADCRTELNGASCPVKVDVAEDLPPIEGDRGALLHCLRNLLGNAAKHAPGAAVEIHAAAAGPDRIEITVEDCGPGLDEEDLEHIFEPFYRGQRAKQEQVHGSGLGLSLVKKITEAHGGKVEAGQRETGSGSYFRLWLPVVKG